MKRSPVILVTPSTDPEGVEFDDPSVSLSQKYPEALHQAGALPWLAPCLADAGFVRQAVRQCDGVLLTGGDDVQPKLYTKRLPATVKQKVSDPDRTRDCFELMVIDEVFRQKKPLLAICRGLQILNVALDGTLVADINAQIARSLNHNCSDRKDEIVHEVMLTEGSLIAAIVGSRRLGVNSSHHQAVARVAKPLRATAVSSDGVVEGLELAAAAKHWSPYLLAVQFHPERLCSRMTAHLNIFVSFTAACRRSRFKQS